MGFIKKIMKQLQKGFNEVQALEIELRILETSSAPPSRPRKFIFCVYFLVNWTVSGLHFFNLVVDIYLSRPFNGGDDNLTGGGDDVW